MRLLPAAVCPVGHVCNCVSEDMQAGGSDRMDCGDWRGACIVAVNDNGDSCVRDEAGDYGGDEACTFTYSGAATTINRDAWEFETSADCTDDYLRRHEVLWHYQHQ